MDEPDSANVVRTYAAAPVKLGIIPHFVAER